MKRLIALLLIAALIFTLGACGQKENAETDENKTIVFNLTDDYTITVPDVGGETNGFTVTGIYDVDNLNGKYITLEHNATGLTVGFVACDRSEVAFSIAFDTPANSSKGVTHILEHCMLCGSEKYPGDGLFFDIFSQTYNTYMNATTGTELTDYHASSMSDTQLKALFDFYIYMVFHPNFLTDESIFMREGWHYVLENPEDELKISGIVYNEMQGQLSNLDTQLYYNTMKTLYAENDGGSVEGGDPDYIPELTYEEFCEYYNTHYHPSNCMITLFGDLDYEYYLKNLNETYLAGYERIETDKDEFSGTYSFSEVKRADYKMAVSADTEVSGNSGICYAIGLGDLTEAEFKNFDLLMTALSSDSSYVSKAVEEAFPGAVFSISHYETDNGTLLFRLENTDAENAEMFMETINNALAECADKGFSDTVIETLRKRTGMATAFAGETNYNIVNILFTYDWGWAHENGAAGYLDRTAAAEAFAENGTSAYLQKLISENLLNPKHAALVTTVPEPGLMEAKEAALAEKLAAYKATLSDAEINEIIEKYKALTAEDETDYSSYIEDLKVISVSDLPEGERNIRLTDTEKDGTRYLTADLEGNQYAYVNYMFNADVLEQSELLHFSFLTDLLFSADTDNYQYEELNELLELNLYEGGISHVTFAGKDNYQHALSVNYTTLIEDTENVQKLFEEVLFNTEFDDAHRIRTLAAELVNENKNYINSSADEVAADYALAQQNPESIYDIHISYFDYIDYLEKVSVMSDDEIASLGHELKNVLSKLLNKNTLAVEIAAAPENQDKLIALAESFAAKLGQNEQELNTYEFEPLPQSIAIKVTGTTNYNVLGASYANSGTESCADRYVMSNLIMNDFLFPELRYNRGAYDAYFTAYRFAGMTLSTYRDGNIRETYEFFDSLPEIMRETEYSQADIDEYIVNAYSSIYSNCGEIEEASFKLGFMYSGNADPSVLLSEMKEAKTTGPDVINKYADAIENMSVKGCRVTAGCAFDIDKNSDLFDLVIDDAIK